MIIIRQVLKYIEFVFLYENEADPKIKQPKSSKDWRINNKLKVKEKGDSLNWRMIRFYYIQMTS